jgi:GcrA cell cycle regulator
MEWNDEQVETLKKLCAQGLPFSVIGARLGISRSAAIGKASRLKIGKSPSKPTAAVRKPVTNFGKRILTLPHIVQIKRLEAMKPPAPAPEPKKLDAAEPVPLMTPLLDLTETQCKWPVNNGGPFLFCAHEKERSDPYCSFHMRAAFQKTPVVLRARKVMARAA